MIKRTKGSRKGRYAFTLVELLVVVAIIALLVSILMPTLNRAKEQAKRVVCLSNLHNLSIALVMYATENDDRIPIGYWLSNTSHEKQADYLIYDPHRELATQLGLLYEAGLQTNGDSWYCPSETFEFFIRDSPTNPWPPGKDVPTPPSGMFPGWTRSGYGWRPTVPWPDNRVPERMTRLTDLEPNTAILADIVSTPWFVDNRHVDGVNVLYAHAGAHWVDIEAFEENLMHLTGMPYSYYSSSCNRYFLDETTSPPTGVWADLDRN